MDQAVIDEPLTQDEPGPDIPHNEPKPWELYASPKDSPPPWELYKSSDEKPWEHYANQESKPEPFKETNPPVPTQESDGRPINTPVKPGFTPSEDQQKSMDLLRQEFPTITATQQSLPERISKALRVTPNQVSDAMKVVTAFANAMPDEGVPSKDAEAPYEKFNRIMQEPSTQPTKGEQVAAGLVNAQNRATSSLTDPVNAALLATGAYGPAIVGRLISAYFTAHMINAAPDLATKAGEASVIGDAQQKTEAYADLGLTGLFSLLAAAHAGKGGVEAISKDIQPIRDAITKLRGKPLTLEEEAGIDKGVIPETPSDPGKTPAVTEAEKVLESVAPETAKAMAEPVKEPMSTEPHPDTPLTEQAVKESKPEEPIPTVKESLTVGEPISPPKATETEVPPPDEQRPPVGEPSIDKGPTAMKYRLIDEERQQRGLEPLSRPESISDQETMDRAMAEMDKDPTAVDRLIARLKEHPSTIEDWQNHMLMFRKIELTNELEPVLEEINSAIKSGEPVDPQLRIREASLNDLLNDVESVSAASGTLRGRALRSLQVMANEDMSLTSMVRRATAAKGKELTDVEREQISTLSKSLQEANQKIADLERVKVEQGVKEVITSTQSIHPSILAKAEKIVAKMEGAAESASKRLREKLKTTSVGVDPTILKEVAIIMAARIARGVVEIGKLTEEMVGKFGEHIRPYITEAYELAKKELDRNATGDEGKILKSMPPSERRSALIERAKEKNTEGKPYDTGFLAQKLARTFVEEGVRDVNELIDKVHEVFKDVAPGITRNEVMNSISGYGQFKPLSKGEIDVKLRDLKGQMQQMGKLESMKSGEAPLKTGIERREASKAEEALKKEVEEMKRKGGYSERDPQAILKTALQTLKKRLKNQIEDLEERLKTGDFTKKPRTPVKPDQEAAQLKTKVAELKREEQVRLAKLRYENRTKLERYTDTFIKWRRGFLLSGLTVLGKLTSAAFQRLAFSPIEEVVGGGLSKALPSLSEKAAREGGFNSKAEAKSITEGITQGMRDSWKTLKTGHSDLDLEFGKTEVAPPSLIDFFGHLHGALKAPAKRAEFARSLEKRTQAAIRDQIDVSDPLVQTRLSLEAYKDAQRAIFQQDNRVVAAYKAALGRLEAPNKVTGKIPVAGKLAATAARTLLPIVKVPTNIAAEIMEYSVGSITGSAKLAVAMKNGMEKMKPEEADVILRHLKKGAIGAAVLAYGYFNPDTFGGYYQPGEKRKSEDVKAGGAKIGGHEIPSYLLHNPLMEQLQIGATIRRVKDSYASKKDSEPRGISEGVWAGALGVAEQVPFVREATELAKAFNPRESGAFWGEMGRSLLVPQIVQQVARWQDDDKKRKPKTVADRIKMGIPGLREEVPVDPHQNK